MSLSTENNIIIYAVGDINLGVKSFQQQAITNEYFPFQHIKAELNNGADIIFGNLESPITSEESLKVKSRGVPSLKASPDFIKGLVNTGFNILNLANNHINDCGVIGLNDTIGILNKYGIHCIGVGKNLENSRKPVIFNIKGKQLGFLGYTYANRAKVDQAGCAPIEKQIILDDIRKLKTLSDVIVISLHEGIEHIDYPNPFSRNLCRQLIDAGASIILRHHSHCIQGIEKYKHGLVAYSLGNFVFDQHEKANWENITNGTLISCSDNPFFKQQLNIEKTRETFILKIIINEKDDVDYSIIPIYIDNNYVPKIANSIISEKIKNKMIYLNSLFNKPEDVIWKTVDNFYKYQRLKKIIRTLFSRIMSIHKIRKRHFNELKKIF